MAVIAAFEPTIKTNAFVISSSQEKVESRLLLWAFEQQ
jgi:hypothetical protein